MLPGDTTGVTEDTVGKATLQKAALERTTAGVTAREAEGREQADGLCVPSKQEPSLL